jgi:hypothetical protein
MHPNALRALAAAGLIGLGVLLFYALFEKRTIEVDTPRDPLVRLNPFRAAELMLGRMGLDVRSFANPRDLDGELSEAATLILPTSRQTLSPARSRALVEWVERGGHLIVVTWTIWDDPERRVDPILDPLGLQQLYDADIASEIWPEDDEDDEDDEREEPKKPEPQPAQKRPNAPLEVSNPLQVEAEPAVEKRKRSEGPPVATVPFPARGEPLRVQFDPRFSWVDSEQRAHFSIADAAGTHLVQVRVGQGLITALTDSGFLSNEGLWDEGDVFHYGGIANFDHAELTYRLVTTGGRTGPVYVVWKEDWPGLGALLLEHGWQTVASGSLLLAVWVWLRSRRFGPVLADRPADRRQLMEHVDAVGRFDWKNDAGRSLVASVRDALLERVKARYPNWAALRRYELAQRLAELAKLPPEQVEQALGPELLPSRGARDRESFVRNIATLEAVRKAL